MKASKVPELMRAAVLVGPGDIQVQQRPVPWVAVHLAATRRVDLASLMTARSS